LVGGAIASVGLAYGLKAVAFVAQAQKVTGVVVRLEKTGTVFHPVIAFTTASGEQVVVTDKQGSNPPPHQVEDWVEVLYPSDHPQQAQENSFLNLWLLPALPLAFGAFWLITGAVMIADGARRLVNNS
jgi:hypothetical protein